MKQLGLMGFSQILRREPAAPYLPGQEIDCGEYKLRLKVNQRARRISLRIDNKTGDAVVTAPRIRNLTEAVEFARSRHDWIVAKRGDQSAPQTFAPGMTLTIRGHAVTLAAKTGVLSARPEQQADGSWHLVTSGDGATYARRIERYLRQQAMSALQAETDKFSTRLGVSGVKISLFDARARWGSCTPSRKAIRYSWRVILAPPQVLGYLAAHECAHLRHPDHSPAFWATVTELFGPYKAARDWLKKHGHELFKYA
jgi:predicted metal-dependent hydrolase